MITSDSPPPEPQAGSAQGQPPGQQSTQRLQEARRRDQHIRQIASDLSLPTPGVQAGATLLDEGATIPFVARYRKEVTGSLDEVAIGAIRDSLTRLGELDQRRASILASSLRAEGRAPS